MTITRLNHAVLYVRDAQRSADFFIDLFGFVKTTESPGGVFLRCSPDSKNDHDLAFFSIGDDAEDSSAGHKMVGMYHLAWEVPTLEQLADYREKLSDLGLFIGATDHGTSRSLYAHDPDGLEFELMWAVPPELHDPELDLPGISPLNMKRDIARFGADTPGRVTS